MADALGDAGTGQRAAVLRHLQLENGVTAHGLDGDVLATQQFGELLRRQRQPEDRDVRRDAVAEILEPQPAHDAEPADAALQAHELTEGEDARRDEPVLAPRAATRDPEAHFPHDPLHPVLRAVRRPLMLGSSATVKKSDHVSTGAPSRIGKKSCPGGRPPRRSEGLRTPNGVENDTANAAREIVAADHGDGTSHRYLPDT